MFVHPEDNLNIYLDLEPYFWFIEEMIRKNTNLKLYPAGIYLPNKRLPLTETKEIAIISNKGGNLLVETDEEVLKTLNVLGKILVDGKIVFEGLINNKTLRFKPDLPYISAIIFKDLFDYICYNINPYKDLLLYNKFLKFDSPYINTEITNIVEISDLVIKYLNGIVNNEVISEITKVYEDVIYRIIMPIIEKRPECVYKIDINNEKILLTRLQDVRAMRYEELNNHINTDDWLICNEN